MSETEQSILVAYDGSDEARRALAYAAQLLRPTTVEIITAYEPIHHQAMKNASAPGVNVVDLTEEAAGEDPNYVQALAICEEGARLADSYGFTCHAHLVECTTSVWSAIVDAAHQLQPDVIVTGTRAQTGLKTLFSSSVSDNVLNNAGLPVLIVPPEDSSPR